MSGYESILAVMQRNEQAPLLLDTLTRLTANTRCDTSVARVVYEGLADLRSTHVAVSQSLKTTVLSSAEQELRDTIEQSEINIDGLSTNALWNASLWRGIVHAATATNANLIVKTTGDTKHGIGLRTPQDWNLLRHSQVPVMLVQAKQWSQHPVLIAAIDVFDPAHQALNERILQQADSLRDQLQAELFLVTMFPALKPWLNEISTMQNYMHLRRDVEAEISAALGHLAKQHGVTHFHTTAAEGEPVEAVGNIVEQLNADCVVLGTKARQGVAGALLGNTAEQLLNAIPCNVLAVP